MKVSTPKSDDTRGLLLLVVIGFVFLPVLLSLVIVPVAMWWTGYRVLCHVRWPWLWPFVVAGLCWLVVIFWPEGVFGPWLSLFHWAGGRDDFLMTWTDRPEASFIVGLYMSPVNGVMMGGLFAPLYALPLLFASKRNSEGSGTRIIGDGSHGSAHWGESSGSEAGVALGRYSGKVRRGQDARYRTLSHVLTCARTGAGKGIGCVLPTLLEHPGSTVVVDIKGEAFATTAERRRQLGQRVVALDPWGLTGEATGSINWLAHIDVTSPDCVADALTLAELMIVRDKHEDSHWADTASNLLQGLILHVAAENGSMGTVRELLTQSPQEFTTLLEHLAADKGFAFGVPARAANSMLGRSEREYGSVLSTAIRHTQFLDDPRIVASMTRSDVDFRALKTEPVSVYLCIPPDRLSAYGRWLRGLIGLCLQGLTRVRGLPEHQVLVLVDEAAKLGSFKQLGESVSLLRGYGIQIWQVYQDLAQVRGIYRDEWETIVANSALQAFGVQDLFTADYVSKHLGQRTIEVESQSASRNRNDTLWSSLRSASVGKSISLQATGRALLTPDEVRRLPPDQVIVLEQGLAPVKLKRLNYLADPEYQGLYDSNPMYARASPEGGVGAKDE